MQKTKKTVVRAIKYPSVVPVSMRLPITRKASRPIKNQESFLIVGVKFEAKVNKRRGDGPSDKELGREHRQPRNCQVLLLCFCKHIRWLKIS
jgi:hypothetical protein